MNYMNAPVSSAAVIKALEENKPLNAEVILGVFTDNLDVSMVSNIMVSEGGSDCSETYDALLILADAVHAAMVDGCTRPHASGSPALNKLITEATNDLQRIVNDHDPEVDCPIKDGVWDRLAKLVNDSKRLGRDDTPAPDPDNAHTPLTMARLPAAIKAGRLIGAKLACGYLQYPVQLHPDDPNGFIGVEDDYRWDRDGVSLHGSTFNIVGLVDLTYDPINHTGETT